MIIKEAVRILYDISREVGNIDGELARQIQICAEQLRMKKENYNIKETICNAIELLEPEAQRNNIKIEHDVKDLQINHDTERIRQVITNLIKNSLIAVQPNSGKIVIRVDDLSTEIKINVEDNGIGIPQEKQGNLFNKFYQVDATLTRESGGSGLGLAICKGIINNHGGEITMQNADHQGAIFSFTIPKDGSEQPKSAIGTT